MGKMDKWQMCKSRTECAFGVSGYNWILTDATYAARNTQMNSLVYSQLEVSTVEGTIHHQIKKHDDDNNGYGEWNYLC